jgi:hypothetical protein
MSRRWLLRAAVLLSVVCAMPLGLAQTLARPGWVGSGMTPNVWWRHAIVYAVDLGASDAGGLKAVAARMDALQTLGVDAVLLRGLQAGAGMDAAAGTMDDFDEVLRQGSRHSIRVLVELNPKTPAEDVTGIARFWLSRGVAGFRLKGGSAEQMRQLRAAAKGYVGERVMIGDAAQNDVAFPVASSGGGSGSRRRGTSAGAGSVGTGSRGTNGPQLVLDASIAVAPLNVGAIRAALEKNDAMNRVGRAVPMLATADGAGGGPEFGRVVATLLLSSRGGTMIRQGQTGEGETAEARSLAEWYGQMSALQHSNATVRTGVNAMLNHDDQNVVAWVRRPQVATYGSPAVVFLCNMTDQPVTLSLRADMQGLKLKGSFFRTLLRSDVGMGAMGLDAVKLAPYGVYVGELKY